MTFTWTVRTRRNPWAARAPTYVYQCPMCQKKFRRKTMNGALNPHKRPDGRNCSCRVGRLIDTQY
jgi:hypothetical protein